MQTWCSALEVLACGSSWMRHASLCGSYMPIMMLRAMRLRMRTILIMPRHFQRRPRSLPQHLLGRRITPPKPRHLFSMWPNRLRWRQRGPGADVLVVAGELQGEGLSADVVSAPLDRGVALLQSSHPFAIGARMRSRSQTLNSPGVVQPQLTLRLLRLPRRGPPHVPPALVLGPPRTPLRRRSGSYATSPGCLCHSRRRAMSQ